MISVANASYSVAFSVGKTVKWRKNGSGYTAFVLSFGDKSEVLNVITICVGSSGNSASALGGWFVDLDDISTSELFSDVNPPFRLVDNKHGNSKLETTWILTFASLMPRVVVHLVFRRWKSPRVYTEWVCFDRLCKYLNKLARIVNKVL